MGQVFNGYGFACLLVAVAPIAGAAEAAADGPAATAGSPDDSSENVATVTVTGIRAAIESAISIKQDSNSIVEAISAEDIGKLPDTSIAESISRLPGLTSQRSDGRACVPADEHRQSGRVEPEPVGPGGVMTDRHRGRFVDHELGGTESSQPA